MGMFCVDCFASYFLLLYYTGFAAQAVLRYPRQDFWNNVFSLQWVLVFWIISRWFYKCAVSLRFARYLNDKHFWMTNIPLPCLAIWIGIVWATLIVFSANGTVTIAQLYAWFVCFLLLADNNMRKFHSQLPSWMCPPLLRWFCVTLFVCTYFYFTLATQKCCEGLCIWESKFSHSIQQLWLRPTLYRVPICHVKSWVAHFKTTSPGWRRKYGFEPWQHKSRLRRCGTVRYWKYK